MNVFVYFEPVLACRLAGWCTAVTINIIKYNCNVFYICHILPVIFSFNFNCGFGLNVIYFFSPGHYFLFQAMPGCRPWPGDCTNCVCWRLWGVDWGWWVPTVAAQIHHACHSVHWINGWGFTKWTQFSGVFLIFSPAFRRFFLSGPGQRRDTVFMRSNWIKLKWGATYYHLWVQFSHQLRFIAANLLCVGWQ